MIGVRDSVSICNRIPCLPMTLTQKQHAELWGEGGLDDQETSSQIQG